MLSEAVTLEKPYLLGNVTRLKMALPCSNQDAWNLVGRVEGLSAWLPVSCKGRVSIGETLEFGWTSGNPDRYRVLDVKEGVFWEMDWQAGGPGRVRYSLRGEDAVIFELEVTYDNSEEGRNWQLLEVAPWAFYLSNLKSVAMKGLDLRTMDLKISWKNGFLD